jgi:hypothetical protein
MHKHNLILLSLLLFLSATAAAPQQSEQVMAKRISGIQGTGIEDGIEGSGRRGMGGGR